MLSGNRFRSAKCSEKTRSTARIEVSGVGRTEQDGNLEWIERPGRRAIRQVG
jgi:hypothetical protein